MSKPVLGLLAGLAVVAAAGRVKRGSFSRHAMVGARSEKAARESFAATYPLLQIVRVEKVTPGLRYKYVVVAEPKGSRSASGLSAPVRLALADLPAQEVKDWRQMMARRGVVEPTDADWRQRFREAGIGALQFGAGRGWKGDAPRKQGASGQGSRAYDEDKDFGSYTSGMVPRAVIEQAVAYHVGEAGTYPIEAHQGTDMLSFLLDANKKAGIQPFRFHGSYGRVGLRYTADELVKLLHALTKLDDQFEHGEDEEDSPGMVRSSILDTLGIEEV